MHTEKMSIGDFKLTGEFIRAQKGYKVVIGKKKAKTNKQTIKTKKRRTSTKHLFLHIFRPSESSFPKGTQTRWL